MTDEFVEEIHEIRKRIAEECEYDFKKLGERLMRLQEQHPEHLVYEVPKSDPTTLDGSLLKKHGRHSCI